MEADPFCREVIAERMRCGYTGDGPIYDDVQVYKPQGHREVNAQAITAGFPCQGVCRAGKQHALGDTRTALLKHVFRALDLTPSVHLQGKL